jgi:hypothetical protein
MIGIHSARSDERNALRRTSGARVARHGIPLSPSWFDDEPRIGITYGISDCNEFLPSSMRKGIIVEPHRAAESYGFSIRRSGPRWMKEKRAESSRTKK